jgi:hypothetical protein
MTFHQKASSWCLENVLPVMEVLPVTDVTFTKVVFKFHFSVGLQLHVIKINNDTRIFSQAKHYGIIICIWAL